MSNCNLLRCLLFTDPPDLSYYRNCKNDILRRDLYRFLINLQRHHGLKWDVFPILNEVFYQCVRIWDDPTPEIDIEESYLHSITAFHDDSDYRKSHLVFSLVWAVFSLQENKNDLGQDFLDYLKEAVKPSEYFKLIEDGFYNKELDKYGWFHTDLAPNPSGAAFPISPLELDVQEYTNNYDTNRVVAILKRYRTIKEQKYVFELIKWSLSGLSSEEKYEIEDDSNFLLGSNLLVDGEIVELEQQIEQGILLPCYGFNNTTTKMQVQNVVQEEPPLVPANPKAADSLKSTKMVMENLLAFLDTLPLVNTRQAMGLMCLTAIAELDNAWNHLRYDKQLMERGIFVSLGHDSPLGNYGQWKTSLLADRKTWNNTGFKNADTIQYANQGLDFEMFVNRHPELKEAVVGRIDLVVALLDDMQHILNEPTEEQLINQYDALEREYDERFGLADQANFKSSMLGVLPANQQSELNARLRDLDTQLDGSGFFKFLNAEALAERHLYCKANKVAVAGYIVRYRSELTNDMIIAFFHSEKMKNIITKNLILCRQKGNGEKAKKQRLSPFNNGKKSSRTPTSFKPTSATFTWRIDEKTRGDRMRILHNVMKLPAIRNKGLIADDTKIDDLIALFQGSSCERRLVIRWTGSIQHLAYFFKSVSKLGNISLPKGKTLWTVVRSHIVDAQGKQFGENLHDQHSPQGGSLVFLNLLVDLMDAKKDPNDVVEELKSANLLIKFSNK